MIAFATEAQRDAGFQESQRIQLIPAPLSYKRRPVMLVQKAFSSVVTVGIPILLGERTVFVRGLQADTVHMLLGVWADACDAQTAVKVHLIDPSRRIFPSGRSRVQLMLEYVGGENLLPTWLPEVVDDLRTAAKTKFWVGPITVSVRRFLCITDHHALGVLCCVPQASANFRDCMGSSLAEHWSLLHDDGESEFRIGDLQKCFGRIQDFFLEVQRLFNEDTSKRKPTKKQTVAFVMQFTNTTIGRILSRICGHAVQTGGCNPCPSHRPQCITCSTPTVLPSSSFFLWLTQTPLTTPSSKAFSPGWKV